jgi:hypothetical protein
MTCSPEWRHLLGELEPEDLRVLEMALAQFVTRGITPFGHTAELVQHADLMLTDVRAERTVRDEIEQANDDGSQETRL